MKKFTLFLAIVFSSALLNAQQSSMSVAQGGEAPLRELLDNEFQCLPNSVFSQVHPTYNDAFYCDSYPGSCFAVAENYTATGPFTTMRFWGGNYWGCTPGTSQTFIIEFYNGIPGSGGTVVNSFTKTVIPQPTGIITPWGNTEFYMIDVNFGTTINQLNGWLSISRVNPGDGCIFGWAARNDLGGNSRSYCSGNWINNNGEMFFCLGGEGSPTETPINSWALLIGVALIAITAIIRFRKFI